MVMKRTQMALRGRGEPYEEVFNKLEDAGFERSSLQSAWWFHTASTKSILEDILIMRDDAEQRLGGDGIGCQITERLRRTLETMERL